MSSDGISKKEKLKRATYREPISAEGLKAIENGTLDYLDREIWPNLNTGVMEEYFEEKNRGDGFFRSVWSWRQVMLGIILGTIFAVITEYVGLKVGIAISGGWYVMYLIGAILKWQPSQINVAAGANTGATYIGTGFIFTFPALYLLATDEYVLADGTNIIPKFFSDNPGVFTATEINIMVISLIATIFTGILGTLYFIILRRIWLVEDPLHTPGWEPNLQLMDISNDIYKGETENAGKSLKAFGLWTAISMGFGFLRDFPVGKMDSSFQYFNAYTSEAMPHPEASIMDITFKNFSWYDKGAIVQPYGSSTYTSIGFGLIPIQIALGWFMKLRVAFLMNIGTFISWFIIVPLAVYLGTPIFSASEGIYHDPMYYMGEIAGAGGLTWGQVGYSPAWAAFAKIARPIAVGTILGAGLTGLFKMLPTFKGAIMDVKEAGQSKDRTDFIKGKGWYEWPMTHIGPVMVITWIVVFILFWKGFPGSNPLVAFVFATTLIGTTFFLGAIAVKVMGETGTQPVSGTSFIVLIILVLIFMALGLSRELTAMMVLIGTTVFAGAISMEGDIIWDFKSGLYVGNRPYQLMKGELTGIIPGAVGAVIAAVIFSKLLALGKMPLVAPQANAFATIIQTFLGGSNLGMLLSFLVIGFLLGMILEFVTGMGTAIGLGMYFPFWLNIPIIAGGIMREVWEKKYFEPTAKAENWTEKQKTVKMLNTYMIATGLIVGEALIGTVVAVLFMFM